MSNNIPFYKAIRWDTSRTPAKLQVAVLKAGEVVWVDVETDKENK